MAKATPKKAKRRAKRPEPKELTAKQGAFALRYVGHNNATRAAIEVGFSEKSAHVRGSELCKNPLVRAEIDRLRAEQAERLQIDADRLLMMLVDEAHADIADLFTAEGGLRPIDEWPMAFRKGLVAGIEVQEEYAKEDEAETEFEPQAHGGALKREVRGLNAIGRVAKIKLADRTRVKELIGRHATVQAWKDRREHTVAGPLQALLEQISGNSIRPKGGG